MCPHTSIEVGQKFQSYTEFVGTDLVSLIHSLMGLVERTSEILNMVTYLMGDDVSVGEVTVGTYLLLHHGEERQVYVQFLVARAIEGSHSSSCRSAG